MAVELTKLRIITLCMKSNVKMKALADGLGIAAPTFSLRLKNPCFKFAEQYKMAEVLGCKFCPTITTEDGKEFTGATVNDIFRNILNYKNITITELSEKIGMATPNLIERLKRGKYTNTEIEKLAEVLDCKYESWFVYDDGTKI